MSQIIHFYHKGEPNYEFTNFASFPVELDGKIWPTTEHYFQAQKHMGESREEQIRLAETPRDAFDLGRSQQSRSDWHAQKVQIMPKAVLAKFTQHDRLRKKLLATGSALLVEHTANDSFWGDGGDGSGKNMLGQILMSVREELGRPESQRE